MRAPSFSLVLASLLLSSACHSLIYSNYVVKSSRKKAHCCWHQELGAGPLRYKSLHACATSFWLVCFTQTSKMPPISLR